MEITEDRKQAIWKEIVTAAQREVEELQQADEMTVRQFFEQTGMNINWARRFLDRQVELGKLKKRKTKIRGRETALYSPIDQTSS